jgi:hypothetical protein
VDEELFGSGADLADEYALAGFGALPRHARLHIFYDTMTKVVFPGLEHLGVDATRGRRWLESR